MSIRRGRGKRKSVVKPAPKAAVKAPAKAVKPKAVAKPRKSAPKKADSKED